MPITWPKTAIPVAAFLFSFVACASSDEERTASPRPKQHVYVLGGNTSTLELAGASYRAPILADGELGEWEPVPELDVQREAASAAVSDDGALILAGGYDPNRTVIRMETEVLVSDLTQPSSWNKAKSPYSGVMLAAATVVRGNWFVLSGGFTGQRATAEVSIAEAGRNGVDSWYGGARRSEPVIAHAMVTVGSRLYLIGGQTPGKLASDEVVAAEFLPQGTPVPSAFTDAGALPAARAFHVAVATSRGILVAGGREGNEGKSDAFLGSVGPDGRVSWKTVASLPAPRVEACAVSDGANVYVLGGRDGPQGQPASTAYVGRIAEDGTVTWSETRALPRGRYRHACAGY